MLQMMGAFSEFERALINERQREGIAAARKAGKQFGRKKASSDDQVAEEQKQKKIQRQNMNYRRLLQGRK